MANKFVSFLERIGHDFKKGLDAILPIAETAGEEALSIFLPGVSPMFNATVTSIVLAEQRFAAVNQQSGTGAQKSALVMQIMEPIIAQGLADLGKANDTAAVLKYVDSVVTILNTLPPNAQIVQPTHSSPASSGVVSN